MRRKHKQKFVERTFLVQHFGRVDSGGDIIMPGSIKMTDKPVLIRKNFEGLPIAQSKATELSDEGMKVIADIPVEFDGLTPAIGFSIVDCKMREDGFREITELKLHEISLCTSPNVDPAIKPLDQQ